MAVFACDKTCAFESLVDSAATSASMIRPRDTLVLLAIWFSTEIVWPNRLSYAPARDSSSEIEIRAVSRVFIANLALDCEPTLTFSIFKPAAVLSLKNIRGRSSPVGPVWMPTP